MTGPLEPAVGALVAAGGAIGAPLRYLTDLWVSRRHDSLFPWGTWLVNVVGSFGLGVVAGLGSAVSPAAATVVGTGVCGALTTFSTFGYETFRLVEEGAWRTAGANVLASLAAGLLACSGGWALAQAEW